MKKIIAMTLLFLSAFTIPAFAAEAPPILEKGIIEVTVGSEGSDVTEQLTLTNLAGFPDGTVEHVFTNLGSTSDLTITADGEELDFEVVEDEIINKVIVTLPEGAGDGFSYNISYSYTGSENRIPIVIPAASTDGNGNDVLLRVTIPEGQYLQSSFPIIDVGETGTLEEYMMNVPNFVNLEISSAPPGFINPINLWTLFGLVIILGFIGAMAYSLFKPAKKTGGSVNA
ncbi:hypothetical protein QWY16_03170 [Planococcus shenhongbingii]|uniref:hypothetical protein n=1 Tax=Planococcus shenhongbingii TaxID=3058398 RepID=UPI00261B8490|nr:hypothetical protein [Planococcus sp. N016]WKA59166.1 hypothetical protein QWY16_03170 [Planococcus sp. N016]